nr:phage tail assembly chaperone [Roseibium sediminis]
MHLAFARLHWSPAVFWSATLAELQAAFVPVRPPAFARRQLTGLMERFPDAQPSTESGND